MVEVSVVIPSYNHAAYIGQAVSSVLSQSITDLELIVIDDGSQDESLEILAGCSDRRLRVHRQTNQGAHAAINLGLRQATGNYLAILNSDDAYHPQRLEKLLEILRHDPQIGLAGSHIRIIDAQGNPLGIKHGYLDCEPWMLENSERSFRAGDDLRAALLTENYFATTSNFVFSRTWFAQVGEFRPLRFTHDWDYALRLAKQAPLMLLPEPLIYYRVHPDNTIRQDKATMLFEICWILAVHLPAFCSNALAFAQQPLEKRIDQLLHSIYTAQCDRVLTVMLLQNLHERMDQALQLLEPTNPARAVYIQYIQQVVQSGPGVLSLQSPVSWSKRVKRHLKRLLR